MRIPLFRASVSLLVSTAIVAGSAGPILAQGFDEGVAPTRSGYDAEGGQFEVPETVENSSGYERPVEGGPAIWNPTPSAQFAGDFCTDKARGMAMDTVAELPGGGTVKFVDDFVLAPAMAAAQVQGSDGDEPLPGERVAAAVLALSTAGAQLVFPEIGLVVQGGQVMLGGTSYAIDSMVAAAHDQQARAIIGETDPGVWGAVDNVAAYTPFIQFLQGTDWEKYRGMTAENLGEYIHSPQDLTAAFGRWEAMNRNFFDRDELRVISDMVGPRLYTMWLAQRVEHIIKLANSELTARNRALLAQSQEQNNCASPAQAAQNMWKGLYSGEIYTPVTFQWDKRIRVHGVVCFGGAQTALYFDHYHLNGQFVGADQREYYRVRNPAAAGGSFCGEWETKREESGPNG